MKQKIAKITTNILNPFLLSFIVFVLLAVESTATAAEALQWALICLALSVFPVFTVVIYLVCRKKLDGIFINTRRQRNSVYILASGFAVIGCVVLALLGAPELLLATFVSGLAAIILYMIINLFWKISLHTAFMSASVVILIIVYGGIAAWTVVLVPLVAWARIAMKLHTRAQVTVGALLSFAVVIVVFVLFGIIGQ
jgi:membrane-associated phospholipid phosphatase